jgi:peptide/nickel transport system ATP-binding protein
MIGTGLEQSPALELSGLNVRLKTGESVVEDVDLCLRPGEILGVVGESGSGKTTTALALLGYTTPGTRIESGVLRINGEQRTMDESMRPLRGSTISYVPQDPGRALNPSLKISASLRDLLRAHRADASDQNAIEGALRRVGLDQAAALSGRYPHQISGGQQQRVSIAVALCCEPAVVVLDEPTTGLDVITQQRILAELERLRSQEDVAMVYVTHDLAVVSQIADRIAVMYAGHIVEEGAADEVLANPSHPYTRGLLASIPDHVRPRVLDPMPGIGLGVGDRPAGCSFAPRCAQCSDRCRTQAPQLTGEKHRAACFNPQQTPPVKSISLESLGHDQAASPSRVVLAVENLGAVHRSRHEVTVAAESISFTVGRGECVALVGESGSGKTTIARTIAGLHPVEQGRILLHDQEMLSMTTRRTSEQLRQVQIIFQNPASALNPRHRVRDTIARPARMLRNLNRGEIPAEVDRLLEAVRLPARVGRRYPHELSGGERQRVAIARALAAGPEVILCDEITSALDVSVQAAVLKLLRDLREELGLSLLFITHNLGVVATVADSVVVLERGTIVDHGATGEVLRAPTAAYTSRLLEAAPSVMRGARGAQHGPEQAMKVSPSPQ